jgi:hypothetical protein
MAAMARVSEALGRVVLRGSQSLYMDAIGRFREVLGVLYLRLAEPLDGCDGRF